MAVPPHPTDAEMELLSVLWGRGPSTVREVFEVISARRRAGYTTVLKLLQIMTEKGLVKRDETNRSHVYRAAVAEAQTQRMILKDLLFRAFGGSKRKLLMSALDATRATPAELDEIRTMFDDAEANASDPTKSKPS